MTKKYMSRSFAEKLQQNRISYFLQCTKIYINCKIFQATFQITFTFRIKKRKKIIFKARPIFYHYRAS